MGNMGETELLEGEVVGTEVVPVQPANLFGAVGPTEVVARSVQLADALKDVIVQKGLFTMIQGKAHVGVDGWQLCGAMVGISAVCVATEPVDGGYKATVEARTQDGRVVGRADALCTKHEKRGPWKSADDYARLSMAQTRATSKALKGPLGFVISLAGYASTPAEEMTFAEPDKPVETRAVPGLLEFTRAAIRSKEKGALPPEEWDPLLAASTSKADKTALLKALDETYAGLGGDVAALRARHAELLAAS